jgi:hypothetical protein
MVARYPGKTGERAMPKGKTHSGDEPLEPLILIVRGQRVILDADLARLYGIATV